MDAKTLCLGALMYSDASGYEIRKLFEDGPFSTIHDVSFGSIYPALTALLEKGWVTCQVAEQNRRPDKKVYSITPEGRAAFLDALSTTPAPDKMRSETLFTLSFGDHLPQEKVLSIVDQYIADYESRLADMQQCDVNLDNAPVRRMVHEYGAIMYETAIRFLQERRILLADGLEEEHVTEQKIAAAGGGR